MKYKLKGCQPFFSSNYIKNHLGQDTAGKLSKTLLFFNYLEIFF